MKTRFLSGALLVLTSILSWNPKAEAVVLITAAQSGPNFVFSYSGNLNTTGLDLAFVTTGLTHMNPGLGALLLGVGTTVNLYHGPSLPAFGKEGDFYGTGSGSGIAVYANGIGIPIGYSSGAHLSGTGTYANQTYASLGLKNGVYESHLANGDFIRLTLVPEPGTVSLVLVGLVVLAGLRKASRNAGL